MTAAILVPVGPVLDARRDRLRKKHSVPYGRRLVRAITFYGDIWIEDFFERFDALDFRGIKNDEIRGEEGKPPRTIPIGSNFGIRIAEITGSWIYLGTDEQFYKLTDIHSLTTEPINLASQETWWLEPLHNALKAVRRRV